MEIKLENLKKSYGEKEIIKGIDLKVKSGELISLLGPSGCGKSTMLFMLAGLEEVSSGKILMDDNDITNLSPDKRGIGLVFQNYALYPHFTVLKNVMYPILNQGVKKEEAKKRAMDVIKSVELEEHILKLPSQLSGGQQQRVAIARAIAKNPSLLLLDEPISNLDAKLKEQTSKEINMIQKKYGITTVFVTHDQQEALAVSDRIVVINEGKIMQVGSPMDLYKNPDNLYVAKFIGTPSINTFDVEIKNKKVIGLENLINGDLDVKDGQYTLGIRPENFTISKKGMELKVGGSKLLGRDIQVTVEILGEKKEVIIRNVLDLDMNKIKLEVDSSFVYIFDKNTEKRVENETK